MARRERVLVEAKQALGQVEENEKLYDLEAPSFSLKTKPKRGEWLACHEERGESTKTFERKSFKAVPHATYNVIYVSPVGDWGRHPRHPPLEAVTGAMKAFFHPLDIQLAPQITNVKEVKERINEYTKNPQWLCKDVFELAQSVAKKDRDRQRREIVNLALTMVDLYPDEEWNFCFGQASLVDGIGVFSLSRFDPLFPEVSSETPSKEDALLILRRTIKVACHEAGHLFGLHHCKHFRCIMNGSNHLEEMDEKPLFMCPLCLRKLQVSLQFDAMARYEHLLEVCTFLGLKEDAAWFDDRIQWLKS